MLAKYSKIYDFKLLYDTHENRWDCLGYYLYQKLFNHLFASVKFKISNRLRYFKANYMSENCKESIKILR